MITEQGYYTIEDASKYYGCSKGYIRKLITTGRLAFVNAGLGTRAFILIKVADLEAFFTSRTIKSRR